MTENPNWGDVVGLYDPDWKKSLPDTHIPFYAQTSIGPFLHRRIPMGRGLVPSKERPPRLTKPESAGGEFYFDAPKLPKELLSRAIDFFTRVYNAHKTEAAVHIVQNYDTLEYDLFVPHQRLSHGGVFSIYNPMHIRKGWALVGTIHSHCNFSAYHSGTDEADAKALDGIHLTIGNLLHDDGPMIEAMVSMNGVLFKYEGQFEDGRLAIDALMDRSDLKAATAPLWWDRYLLLGTYTDADRPRIAPYATDTAWDRFMGKTKQPPRFVNAPVPQRQFHNGPASIPQNQHLTSLSDWWDAEWRDTGYKYNPDNTQNTRLAVLAHIYEALGQDFLNILTDSGLLNSDVLDEAYIEGQNAGLKEYWETVALQQFQNSMKALRGFGFTISGTVEPPEEEIALLPEPKQNLTKKEKREAKQTGAVL